MKKELQKNNWDFVLYKDEDDIIINVVFFDKAIDYSRNFKVGNEVANLDFESLKTLSSHIRDNYEIYKDKEIHT